MKLKDDAAVSRRQFVGGVTAAITAPTLAQKRNGPADSAKSPHQSHKQDPTTQYPRPPFPPQQQQQPPGLASKMNPRPDHGETSYRGSGRLNGRKALITGGDSGIGRAVAIAFAREGADVAINYLPAEQSDADATSAWITKAGRKAVQVPGDVRSREACYQVVADATDGLGGLDILVNNAGFHWDKGEDGLEGLDPDNVDRVVQTNLVAVIWLCKAALPHLGAGAAIINTTSI